MQAKKSFGGKHEHTCSTQSCHRSAGWTPRLPCPAAGTVTTDASLPPAVCMRPIDIAERGSWNTDPGGTAVQKLVPWRPEALPDPEAAQLPRLNGRPGAYKGMGKGLVAQGRSPCRGPGGASAQKQLSAQQCTP